MRMVNRTHPNVIMTVIARAITASKDRPTHTTITVGREEPTRLNKIKTPVRCVPSPRMAALLRLTLQTLQAIGKVMPMSLKLA
ncbi:hypothetical protein BGW39_007416 [Mortierella sp. 14UC]|nr:hypothetical protein BGW39_007416 [Mortierella sp. 14UC]